MLVVGDTHIGKEFFLARGGIHFTDASRKMAQDLLSTLCAERAKGLVILGDVKESIGYPPRKEIEAIASFFNVLDGTDITITKGNHDAHLPEVLHRLGYRVQITDELLLKDVAMVHGNAMPSREVLHKEAIFAGHSHIAVRRGAVSEKAWLVARPGRGARARYGSYNKDCRLVIAPAFSGLITGMDFDPTSARIMPLLRNKVFNPLTAKMYGLDGHAISASRGAIS